jgi:hypothetical protein
MLAAMPQTRRDATDLPPSSYRNWRKAQDFLITLGWVSLAIGAVPLPAAILLVELGLVESSSPIGTLVFFGGFLAGLFGLPLGLGVATWSGVALLCTGVRARLNAAPGDVHTFRESGAFPLFNGAALLGAAVLTTLAVGMVVANG